MVKIRQDSARIALSSSDEEPLPSGEQAPASSASSAQIEANSAPASALRVRGAESFWDRPVNLPEDPPAQALPFVRPLVQALLANTVGRLSGPNSPKK